MYVVLSLIIGFVIGYGVGVYTSKKARQELMELITTLNEKIDKVQNSINKKVNETQEKMRNLVD